MHPTPAEPSGPPRLPWSFWLVAFAPVLTFFLAGAFIASQHMGRETGGFVSVAGSVCGVPLNLATSVLAGLRYARWNKPKTWRAGHVAWHAVMFFVLNLLLLPAGCAVAGLSAKLMSR